MVVYFMVRAWVSLGYLMLCEIVGSEKLIIMLRNIVKKKFRRLLCFYGIYNGFDIFYIKFIIE